MILYDFTGCSATVVRAPRFIAPLLCWLTKRIGAHRVLAVCRYLPSWHKDGGLCSFGKDACTITPDGRLCLTMKPEWGLWLVTRALNDFQAQHWHGVTLPVSPPQTVK